MLGDGSPKIGAHGKPVLFLHPKDFAGTLVELEAGMNVVSGASSSSSVIWFVALLVALPIGVTTQERGRRGGARHPRLGAGRRDDPAARCSG